MLKNVLFDLGGLFITVYTDRFERWLFSTYPAESHSVLFRQRFDEAHHAYEKGGLSTARFLLEIRYLLGYQVEEQEIEQAWNSILGAFSLEDLSWASGLRSFFRTSLLSNTNELHRESFEESLRQQTGGRELTDYFDGVYYSQRLGLRKPALEIYFRVLELQGWRAEETLLVDDNPQNVRAAAQLGMGAVLHPCNAPLRPQLEARLDLPFHQLSLLS